MADNPTFGLLGRAKFSNANYNHVAGCLRLPARPPVDTRDHPQNLASAFKNAFHHLAEKRVKVFIDGAELPSAYALKEAAKDNEELATRLLTLANTKFLQGFEDQVKAEARREGVEVTLGRPEIHLKQVDEGIFAATISFAETANSAGTENRQHSVSIFVTTTGLALMPATPEGVDPVLVPPVQAKVAPVVDRPAPNKQPAVHEHLPPSIEYDEERRQPLAIECAKIHAAHEGEAFDIARTQLARGAKVDIIKDDPTEQKDEDIADKLKALTGERFFPPLAKN